MQSAITQSFVVVGRVSRPFGVKGWNHLTSFTDPPENLFQYRPWALRDERSDAEDWSVVSDFSIQPKGNSMLVCFEKSNSRDEADKYVNKLIGVPRDVLPMLDEKEHYWVDLLGVEVINLKSEHLGVVHDVAWNGAHPVLVVRVGSEQDLMIPFIPEYVHNVDSGSKITVSWDRDWA